MDSIDTNTAMHISRELGSMDARITNIERDVGEIKNSQTDMAKTLAKLVEAQAAQKGGRAALFTVGGGGVSVGALLVAIAQWLGIGAPQPAVAQPAPVQRTAPAQTTDQPVKSPPVDF